MNNLNIALYFRLTMRVSGCSKIFYNVHFLPIFEHYPKTAFLPIFTQTHGNFLLLELSNKSITQQQEITMQDNQTRSPDVPQPMTQEEYEHWHDYALCCIDLYASGSLLLSELKAKIAEIPDPMNSPVIGHWLPRKELYQTEPTPMRGLIDPASGLSF